MVAANKNKSEEDERGFSTATWPVRWHSTNYLSVLIHLTVHFLRAETRVECHPERPSFEILDKNVKIN